MLTQTDLFGLSLCIATFGHSYLEQHILEFCVRLPHVLKTKCLFAIFIFKGQCLQECI